MPGNSDSWRVSLGHRARNLQSLEIITEGNRSTTEHKWGHILDGRDLVRVLGSIADPEFQ